MTVTVPQPTRAIGRFVPQPVESWRLADLGRPVLAIEVHATPSTQGSKSFKGLRRGKPVLVESSEATLRPWRAAVAAAAISACPSTWEVLDEPLVADLVVSLARTTRVPKTLRTVPATKPDLDKLLRAANDALCTDTAALGRPILTEDSRITSYRRLDKLWVADPYDTDSLRTPGAVIRLWTYPKHLLGRMEPRHA